VLVGNGASNWLLGSGGDDFLAGLGSADRLVGELGNDTLEGGEGGDALEGGGGFDFASYQYAAAAGVVVWLDGTGTNTSDAAGDYLDSIEGLIGSGFGDYLIGNSAGNQLYGLGGSDYLYGFGGNDTLAGGADGDVFSFYDAVNFGNDVVLDFQTTAVAGAAHDTLDFRFMPFTSWSLVQDGGDTLITHNMGSVRLTGINAGTLALGDFLF
jgi:Ca2+-binding RTX toxin-like protein